MRTATTLKKSFQWYKMLQPTWLAEVVSQCCILHTSTPPWKKSISGFLASWSDAHIIMSLKEFISCNITSYISCISGATTKISKEAPKCRKLRTYRSSLLLAEWKFDHGHIMNLVSVQWGFLYFMHLKLNWDWNLFWKDIRRVTYPMFFQITYAKLMIVI